MAKKENPRVCGECGWFFPRTYRCCWESNFPMPPWARPQEHQRYLNPLFDASKCPTWKPTDAKPSTAEGDQSEP